MPKYTIDDVIHFVESNKSFFTVPLENQEAFQGYFLKQGTAEAIADYSRSFIKILTETMHTSGKYKAPLLVLWKNGQFEEALQHEKLRQFIMDNTQHPAIISWQKEHKPKEIPKEITIFTDKEKDLLIKSIEKARDILESHIKKLESLQIILAKSPNSQQKHSKENIKNITGAIESIKEQRVALLNIRMSLGSTRREPRINDIRQQLYTVRSVLQNTITSKLLDIKQEEPVRSLGEKLLNFLATLFCFGGYQSQSTKDYKKAHEEVRPISDSSDKDSLPKVINTYVSQAKEELQKLKPKVEEDLTESPKPRK